MDGGSPIVPVLLPSGAIHFAKVNPTDTGQEIIQVLLATDGVKADILGDLEEFVGEGVDWEWALQHVRKHERGMVWQDEGLNSLDDGILSNDFPAEQLLPKSKPSVQRHFSAFPLTSHLHSPSVRLVSQHSYLSFHITFERVPEIPDGFVMQWFIAHSTTASDIITDIGDNLGLALYIAGPGGGKVDYCVELYSIDGGTEPPRKLDPSTVLTTVLQQLTPRRRLRLVVPEEWYRRPKSKTFPSLLSLVNDDTLKFASSINELGSRTSLVESQDNGDGTAKQGSRQIMSAPSSPDGSKYRRSSVMSNSSGADSPSRRSSYSANRLSYMFDSWLSLSPSSAAILPSQPNAAPATPERVSVSSPLPIDPYANQLPGEEGDDLIENDEQRAEFEEFMDEFGIKPEQRQKMREMTWDRKKYLIMQSKSRSVPTSPSALNISSSATFGPSSSTTSLVPKLLPQLSGGALGRFSGRFGSWTTSAGSAAVAALSAGEGTPRNSLHRHPSSGSRRSLEPTEEEPTEPTPTSKGGLWASWWGAPGQPVVAEGERSSDKGKSAVAELARVGQAASPSSINYSTVTPYVAGITGTKPNSTTLVKHLVSLRIHAATAKLDWIKEFLGPGQGMEALSSLIVALVKNGDKRRNLTQSESMSLLECIKCIRVLVNTDPGLAKLLSMPNLIFQIVTCLDTGNLKIRSNVADLLAGISVVSEDRGHRMVLDAFSDFAIVNREDFRFENLIETLRVHDTTPEALDEIFWAETTTVLVLLVAITASCPDLEQRVALRDELTRRGFNEIIVTLRYLNPPTTVIERLDGYCEDKLDDEEDLRALTTKQFEQSEDDQGWGKSEAATAFDKLVSLAESYDGLPDTLLEILRAHIRILEQETTLGIKSRLFVVLHRFISQLCVVEDLEHDWIPFLKQYVASVQDITGICPDISSSESASQVNTELEALRKQIVVMKAENTGLSEKAQRLASELETVRSVQARSTGQENMHGIVQRLVQKEKAAVRLQAEVDKLRSENERLVGASEEQERIKRERDRAKWSAMSEEMSNSKARVVELETSLREKDKTVTYLKRAMEALCSRFESTRNANQAAPDTQEPDFDAEKMTKHAIEGLAAKEEEISKLRQELSELNGKLADAQSALKQQLAERDFKSRVAPPPPPPLRRPSQPLSGSDEIGAAPIPPPPAPPPPPTPLSPIIQSPMTMSPIHSPTSLSPIIQSPVFSPPAPPPPPPPLHIPPAVAISNSNSVPPPPPPPPPPPVTSPIKSPISPPPPPPPPPPPAPNGIPPPPGAPPPPPPPSNGLPAWKLSRPSNGAPPAKKLKPFFWEKAVKANGSNTVWGQLGMMGGDVELEDLEDVFSLEQVPSKIVTTSQVIKTKKQVTTMLDITRANNVAIMLKMLKMPPTAIRDAILAVDDSRLTPEDLVAISKQLPTAEEANRIQDFGDSSKLAEADQYFSEILKIPRLQERLSCMIYRRSLELEIIEAQPDLSILHDAAVELCTSDKLRKLLQVVLAVGNALNKSTFRGGASGFRLKSLLKLKETKTAKADAGCPTLLHYIARVLLRSDSSTILFIEQLPHLESAARISVQTVMQSVTSIEAGLNKTTSEIISCRKASNSPSDRFGAVMQPFIRSSAESVYALKALAESTQTKLTEMISYFGESTEGPDATKPEDVFELILSFASSLQKTALEVNATIVQPSPSVVVATPDEESVATTPKQEPKELLSPADASLQGSISSVHLSAGRGDLDQALRSLRSGRRRPRQERPLSKIFLDGGNNRRSRLYE